MSGPPRLVLASSSRYRAELLGRLGLPFDVVAPAFDERRLEAEFAHGTPAEFARKLASGKAHAVARALEATPELWILASDQLAVVPAQDPRATAQLLHKPGPAPGAAARAVDQLLLLAGREHRLVTAVVLLHPLSAQERAAVDEVALHMRAFGREEAAAYVAAHAPFDCVGSYRIEDAGIRLFRAIDGADPTSIMGLPLLATCGLLRGAGLLPGDIA